MLKGVSLWTPEFRELIGYTGIMDESGFEEIEHTADLALRARGKNLEELLLNAARGMLQVSGAQAGKGPAEKHTIEIEAQDREMLLVMWLEELLFAMETRGVTFSDMRLDAEDGMRLRAMLLEVPLAALETQIKAVTYHALQINDSADGLEATVVFDV